VVLGAMPTSSAAPIKTLTSPDLADLHRANINAATALPGSYSALCAPWLR
jgi:hypothetical protein